MNREEQLKEALRQAQTVIKDLKNRLDQHREPIAVIGLGCRVPTGGCDAVGLEAFHDFLMQGQSSVRQAGPERAGWWLAPGQENDPILNQAAFLERNPFAADYEFFHLHRAEARLMDPQFHLMLETAWQAVENAGLSPADLAGSDTGVFVGRSGTEFAIDLLTRDKKNDDDPYTLTGNMGSSLSGRIAYFFDWYGPTISLETACSTGLVAVIQAMESLWAGRSSLALAGAVNLLIGPSPSRWLKAMGALSPSGACQAFGAGANGFVRGEGAAALLLKPYAAAKRDGNRILALLAGGVVGADGHSAGFTVGSAKAQKRVMTKALAEAGLKPLEVAYVETHGTGTPVGDPIEAESLLAVYGRERPKASPLIIGSVKSNMGHLEAAAGLVGLVKAIGSVKFGQLYPSLHADKLNPLIDWADSPLEVNRSPRPWPAGYARKVAGVSSFAISGTLAHLIVVEAPIEKPQSSPTDQLETLLSSGQTIPPQAPDHSLILTAFDEKMLRQTAADCLEYLTKGIDFKTMAEAAQRRSHGPERLVITATNNHEAAQTIQNFLEGQVRSNWTLGRIEPNSAGGPLFVFSGQGSQAPGLGRELYKLYPVFRQILDHCEEVAAPRLGHSLLEVMFSPNDPRLNQTQVTLVTIFAHQVALTKLLETHGCRPAAVMGHSIGEYAAAVAAGIFSLDTGLDLVLTIGHLAKILETEERPLVMSQAFHSPLVEPLLAPWADHLNTKEFGQAQIPFLSTLTGDYLKKPDQGWPAYFGAQIRQPMRWSQALLAAKQSAVLELGGQPTLTNQARQIRDDFSWQFAQNPGRDHRQYLMALASLFSRGQSASVGNPPQSGPGQPEAMPPTRFRSKPLDTPGLTTVGAEPHTQPGPTVKNTPPLPRQDVQLERAAQPKQPLYPPASLLGTSSIHITLIKEQCKWFKKLCTIQIKQLELTNGNGDK